MTTTTDSDTKKPDRWTYEDHIAVLDKGYVRYIDHMGSDLRVVNAARASFQKESLEFGPNDARLLNFLVREGHWSPFRHAVITLEFKAPLMVARQHWKYIVGSDHTMDGWNEASRRYVTMEPEFYVPASDQWRSAPDNKKQGSGGPIGAWEGAELTNALERHIATGSKFYSWAMEMGVAAEIARGFLPMYMMYTNYWWTGSLQSMCHFLNQRMEEDAQREIQDYAKAVFRILQPRFPVTINALLKDRQW